MTFEFIFGGVFALILFSLMIIDKKEYWLPLFFGAIVFMANVFLFVLARKISFFSPYNGFFLCVLVILNGVAIAFIGHKKKLSIRELVGGLIAVFGFISFLFANAFAREAIKFANWIKGLL